MKRLIMLIFVLYSATALTGAANISEADSGGDWPFTVSSGVLSCTPRGKLHIVTFSANGNTYAVNGTAKTHAKSLGLRDSDEIWKRDPKYPQMRVSSDIVKKGISLCKP